MNVMKNKKLFYIFGLVSICLCALVCIPFSSVTVKLSEVIIKYAIFGAAILTFTVFGIIRKYKVGNNVNKFNVITTYLPIFSFSLSLLLNTVLVLARGLVFSQSITNLLLIIFPVLMVALIFASHQYYKKVFELSKTDSILIDVIIGVVFLALVCVTTLVCVKAVNVKIAYEKNALFGLFAFIASVVVGGVHCLLLYGLYSSDEEYKVVSTSDLYDEWKKQREYAHEAYLSAREDILINLFDYSASELGFEEEVIDNSNEEVATTNVQTKVVETKEIIKVDTSEYEKRIAELEKELDEALNVIGASKGVILETLQKCSENDSDLILTSLNDSINVIVQERTALVEQKEKMVASQDQVKAELQAKIDAYNQKQVELEEERKRLEEQSIEDAKRRELDALNKLKEKEAIVPGFSAFVLAAKEVGSDRDDMELVPNDNETIYRLTCHGKFVLAIQSAASDYRVTFLTTRNDRKQIVNEYKDSSIIIDDKKSVNFATSKNELPMLKVIYKGDGSIEFTSVVELMNNSLVALIDAEKAEQEAKDLIQAQKDRAKEAEKALREKEKAEAKAQREAEKEALKEAERLAKEQEAESSSVEESSNPEDASIQAETIANSSDVNADDEKVA